MANDDFLFDDDNSDADITADYDDEEAGGISAREQTRRQEAFEKEVAQKRHMLSKPKDFAAKDRIAAAYWLGEAGDPQAIPELVLVYNRDKTKGMKEAATYALGMFKAMQIALDDPEVAESIYDTTERIIFHGEFGKRYHGSRMLVQQIVLALLAVILLLVGFFSAQVSDIFQQVIPEPAATEIRPTATPTDEPATPTEDTFDFAVAELSLYYRDLDSDTRVLQGQMAAITRGESQDCTIAFTNPESYSLSQARRDDDLLPDIVTRLNAVRNDLESVRDAFSNACDTNTAIARTEGLELAQAIINVQTSLRGIETDLFSEATGAEAPPTLELTATPFLTPTASPTLDVTSIRIYVASLSTIIDGMTGPIRGDATRQAIYWQNILDFGSSEGCEQPLIEVPEDYIVPTSVGEQFPTLLTVASNVNIGLQLMRESVSTFESACNARPNDDITQIATLGRDRANAAIQAFNDAETQLEPLQE